MTANEFKAWLEGFSEAFDGPPNKEQWKKIQDKASELYEPVIPNPWYVYPTTIPYTPTYTDYPIITSTFGTSGHVQ